MPSPTRRKRASVGPPSLSADCACCGGATTRAAALTRAHGTVLMAVKLGVPVATGTGVRLAFCVPLPS